jgi:hypothetical protein
MSGAIPLLPQYAFMAWCSVAQYKMVQGSIAPCAFLILAIDGVSGQLHDPERVRSPSDRRMGWVSELLWTREQREKNHFEALAGGSLTVQPIA